MIVARYKIMNTHEYTIFLPSPYKISVFNLFFRRNFTEFSDCETDAAAAAAADVSCNIASG